MVLHVYCPFHDSMENSILCLIADLGWFRHYYLFQPVIKRVLKNFFSSQLALFQHNWFISLKNLIRLNLDNLEYNYIIWTIISRVNHNRFFHLLLALFVPEEMVYGWTVQSICKFMTRCEVIIKRILRFE